MTPKKVTTQLSAFLLTLTLVLTLLPPAHAAAAPFVDVPSSHWAYSEIMEAYADGAVNGTSADRYNPAGNVTMAQFIAILTRAFCADMLELYLGVAERGGAWYEPYYEAAYDYSVLVGVPDGDRVPDAEVTREVMAQMMYNLMRDHAAGPDLSGFSGQGLEAAKEKVPDFRSVAASYGEAVGVCYALGLITGIDSAGRFSPQGRVTRAQTAVIYVRLKQVMETGEGIAPAQTGPQTGPQTGTSSGVLTNGKPATEENVLALIEEYRNGTRLPGEKARAAGFTSYMPHATYDAYNPPYYSTVLGISGTECAKFAYAFWDDIFGDLPMREFTGNPEDVRPGDLLDNPNHVSIAAKHAFQDAFWGNICTNTVSGGASGSIGWSSGNTRVDSGNTTIYTRYPET